MRPSIDTVRVTLAALAALSAACGRGGRDEPRNDGAPRPVMVRTTTAVVEERRETYEAGGTLRGRTSATLSSRVMAPVEAVLVQPGDRVRAGQVLLRLDDRDVTAQARAARARVAAAERGLDAARAEQAAADAALALARATHARMAVLAGRKSATPQELDEATATLRGAEARTTRAAASVAEARAALDAARAGGEAAEVGASFTRVTAPFDGLVTEKLVEPGNLAVPGTPLLRIEDTSGFKLEVRIDESRAAWVSRHAGVPVTVDAPTGPRTVAGRVDEVARAIDADARALLVTIALPPADDLRAGMFGRASIPGPVRRTLTVPDEALVRHGQLSSVFVVDNGRARMRLVNAGRSQAARVEVLAGLAEGERVVVGPPAGLRDGAALVDGPAGAREGGRS